MAFVPVPGTVEVRFEATLGDAEQMVNVLHYVTDGAADPALTFEKVDALSGLLVQAWETNLQPVVSSEVVLQRITFKSLHAADEPVYQRAGIGAAGDLADAMLPFQTCLVTSLRTFNGSRGGRGRIFWGGFTEANNEPGDMASGAAQAACQAMVTEIRAIQDDDLAPTIELLLGVTSKGAHVGGDPEAAPVAPITRAIVDWSTNRRWDTQRRRSNKIRI